MQKTRYAALVTVNGIVKGIEGNIQTGLVGIFGGGVSEVVGTGITDALNKCDGVGYECFEVDTIGNKKIYRLRLKAK